MKKILLLITMMIIGAVCFSQDWEEPPISTAMLIDYSFHGFKREPQSPFRGTSIQGGLWFQTTEEVLAFGTFFGYVQSQLDEKSAPTYESHMTVAVRLRLCENMLQSIPFVSIGTNGYRDVGMRIALRVAPKYYAGMILSRMMYFGASVSIALLK